MRVRPTHFFLILTLLASFFAAGTIDVLFGDVIPIRPYDSFIRWIPQYHNGISEASKTPLGGILTVLFIILVIAALAPSVANATTGITIAHAGFTPNINLTRSPGVPQAVQILPLIFIGIGIGYALDEMGGIL